MLIEDTKEMSMIVLEFDKGTPFLVQQLYNKAIHHIQMTGGFLEKDRVSDLVPGFTVARTPRTMILNALVSLSEPSLPMVSISSNGYPAQVTVPYCQ